jgi:hypothetical protein
VVVDGELNACFGREDDRRPATTAMDGKEEGCSVSANVLAANRRASIWNCCMPIAPRESRAR